MSNKRFRFRATCPECGYTSELASDAVSPVAVCCHCLVDSIKIVNLDLAQIVDGARGPR